MPEPPREVELKLRIPAAAASELLRHPAVAALKRGRTRRARLVSFYFDTPDRRLAKDGIALRLRRAGSAWLQTLKGPSTAERAGGLDSRVECEWRLKPSRARPSLDLAKLATTPFAGTIERALRRGPLVPLFSTDFVRTTVPLAFPDATRAVLGLDHGAVRARGGARAAISELEIELQAGSAARLFELAGALSGEVPFRVETRSKAERGLGLVTRQRANPVRATPIAFRGDASAAEALVAMLRNALRQVEANADGVISERDPEWIHQMRVGVRRLRLVLALIERTLPAGSIAPLIGGVRGLADALGRARDLDVFLAETIPAIAKDVRGAASMQGLAARARKQASAARRDARSAVASLAFTRLQLVTGWLAALPLLGAAPESSQGQVLAAPARALAVERLTRRHRALMRSGEDVEHASPEDRHRLRIAAKKMRYTAEFFVPVFGEKRSREFRRAIVALQEELGAINDAAVAATLAAALAGTGSQDAALVAGWSAARIGGRDESLARAWRDTRKARPYWDEA